MAASRMTVTVLHLHLGEELDVPVDCRVVAALEDRLLAAGRSNERHLAAAPDLVAPIDPSADLDGRGRWRLQFRPDPTVRVRLVRL